MQCAEIHEDKTGCSQDINAADGWKFCPRCGRLASHLKAPENGKLTVDFGKPGRSFVTLRNNGAYSIHVNIALSGAMQGVDLAAGSRQTLVVAPRAATKIEIDLPAFQKSARQIGTLLLEANDGPRGATQGLWDDARLRSIRIPLSVHVAAPASVVVVQEIVLFRDGVNERTIEMRNTGQADAEVVEVYEPDGYEVTPRQGVIAAEGSLEFKIRTRPMLSASHPKLQEAIFLLADGTRLNIALHRPPSSGIQRIPKAIIGVDFGTAFTTVAFREYRNAPGIDDPVTFLRLSDEPDPRRFRTRLWLSQERREFKFASDATKTYNTTQASAFLFREIKTLLRTDNRDFIYPVKEERRNAALDHVRRLYGVEWPQSLVSEYLRWLYQTLILPEIKRRYGDAVPYIRYVFSLPVLDFNPGGNHPIYDRQRTQMEACVASAGFPTDAVDYQFEPVCAAMGLLHPEDGPDWPHLGTQKSPLQTGDAIALFDSGGGTTDVVLMKATVNEGKVALDVERCLGVGSETETFGGELVTDNLLRAIRNPRSIELEEDDDPWFEGTLDLEKVFGEDVVDRDLELRDAAEKLKQGLAQDDEVTYTGGEIRADLLYYLVQRYLASLTKALPEHVFDQISQEKTRYYLCVGGNTALPVVQRWVERHMADYNPEVGGRRLSLPEDYRKLAVAYGAVWVWDARIRNAVPYALRVEAHDTPLLNLAANTSEEAFPRTETLAVPAHTTLDCRVLATINDQTFQVDAGSIFNPYDEATHVDLRTDVQHGIVRVLFKLGDQSDYMPLINYRL
jgi:molecular chaperone DnaK (HSP70)